MEIVKEVPAPVGALTGKPWIRLHKRLMFTNEKEEKKGFEPLVHKARKSTCRSPKRSSSKYRGSVGGSSSSSSEEKSSFGLQKAMPAFQRQSGVAGPSAQPTESQRQSGGAGHSV